MNYFNISVTISIIITIAAVSFFLSFIKQGSMGGGGDPGALVFLLIVLSLIVLTAFINGLVASILAWLSGVSSLAPAATIIYAVIIPSAAVWVGYVWNK